MLSRGILTRRCHGILFLFHDMNEMDKLSRKLLDRFL